MQTQSRNTALIGIIAIVILAAAVVGTIALKPQSDSSLSETTTSSSTENNSEVANDTPTSSSAYKDGTYTATGRYTSPGGNEEIDVTITITDNKVTATSATPQAATRESMQYQDDFVSGYKQLVIGKDVATIKLSKVSGSSLTSRGFNEALDKIRTQAQS